MVIVVIITASEVYVHIITISLYSVYAPPSRLTTSRGDTSKPHQQYQLLIRFNLHHHKQTSTHRFLSGERVGVHGQYFNSSLPSSSPVAWYER